MTKTEIPAGSKALVLGFVLAALMALILMLEAKPAHADTTFTVTRTDDSGDPELGDDECGFLAGRGGRACTLRAAIEQANATPGADTINFNIPDDPNVPDFKVKTISPASELPEITKAATIDGYSQPGSKKNTKQVGSDAILNIELDGTFAGDGANGLVINANSIVVRGLVINRFGDDGIEILPPGGGAARNNIVEGNFIGTDPAGTEDLGNGTDGVFVEVEATDNLIGGRDAAARNVISGNQGDGVVFFDNSNRLENSYVGTDASGTKDLGNGRAGVDIDSDNNFVGGTEAGAANIIAFNGRAGVEIRSGSGNRILNNSIFFTGALGIDLGGNGRTLNDPKDPDTGPNKLQNFPVLTEASSVGDGKITIKGKLDSTPSTKNKKRTFTIQFFSNPSGTDEGKTFLGQTKVTTNRQGRASFSFETTTPVPDGDEITATSTGPGSNTSEFSDPETLIID